MERKHYDAIDVIRTISCIGIMMMHVRVHCTYKIFSFL